MNKKLLVVAIGAALAAPAFAQSSNVTLYGRINTAIESNKIGGQSQALNGAETSMRSYSSRLGVRGVEDLGGGLKGVFGIESQLASDTGSGGLGGGLRNSYVGLDTGSTGRVVLGRLDAAVNAPLYTQAFGVIDSIGYDTAAHQLANSEFRNLSANFVTAAGTATTTAPIATAAAGSTTNNTLNIVQRKSNSIGYDVTVSGVKIGLRHTMGVGDQSGTVVDNTTANSAVAGGAATPGENNSRTTEIAANYTVGALTVGAGFEKASFSTAQEVAGKAVFDNRFQLVAGYDFGVAKIGGLIARNKVKTVATTDDESGNELALSATVPLKMLSPKVAFVANYAQRDLIGIAAPVGNAASDFDGKRKQYAYGARYDFSTRTQAYGLVSFTNGSDKTSGNELRSLTVGVRHNF